VHHCCDFFGEAFLQGALTGVGSLLSDGDLISSSVSSVKILMYFSASASLTFNQNW